MDEKEILARARERERNARKAAESLLEVKSRELFAANLELRELTNELRQQSERIQAILNIAAEGILTVGANELVETSNCAAENIFGLSKAEVCGCRFDNLVSLRDSRISLGEILQLGKRTSDYNESHLRGNRKGGVQFPLELSISTVEVESGVIHVVILRDVSERRALERRLALAQKLESVGQLAAGVAHEINTPIQFVGENISFLEKAFGSLELLFSKFDDLSNSEAAESESLYVELYREMSREVRLDFLRQQIPEAIKDSIVGAKRVSVIVGAMKEFSHPGSIDKEMVDINAAINSTITVSQNEWRYVAELETELCGSLPLVPCVLGEFNQALLNLVVNASHAITDGAVENGLIKISSAMEGDHAVVAVSDNGIGIPEEDREKLFQPFYTTKEVGRGTGQGLAIVYSVIVEKHGGAIEIDSELGFGTTFKISLPIERSHS